MSVEPTGEMPAFSIRPAKSVEEVLELWWPLIKDLGWNRDRDDALTHYRAAGNGKDWLMVVPEATSKPEGCVVGFKYPNNTAWFGFFLMNAPFRGRRMGAALGKDIMSSFHTSDMTYLGLDGVEEQKYTYQRRGFEVKATIKLVTRPSLKEKPTINPAPLIGTDEHIMDIKTIDPEHLAQFDLAHTGLYRPAYWSQEGLLSREDAYGYALCSSAEGDSTLSGYIFVRRSEYGHRFGPLYAETYAQALFLLHQAMENISQKDGSMIAEIFESNAKAMEVFEQLGWKWTGQYYNRMWHEGKVPKEQQEGGKGIKGMFAIFDACAG